MRPEAGRIVSMKNSNDTIGNRTHDLPACRAVPQPTAPLRAPTLPVMFGQVPQPQFCVSHLFSGIFPPINAGWS